MMKSVDRVLSIQSHVVCGYVGNKSAVFPLQVLGFDVDAVNTVQLSNHTGYAHIKGQVLNDQDLRDLYDGLKLNNLHHYSHLLTGYIGASSFASEVVNVVKDLKKINPDLYFVCDPVMGDNNQMYVPKEILPIYQNHLVPLANLLTPNQFEIELLTGISIKNEDDAQKAMQLLHDKGVETVVISSAKLNDSKLLTMLGSTIKDGQSTTIKMEIPEISAVFTGTGDLFAATLLGWMSRTGGDLKVSCEHAINTLQCVIHRTFSYAKEHAGQDGKLNSSILELRLIQSKGDIEKPKPLFSATVL